MNDKLVHDADGEPPALEGALVLHSEPWDQTGTTTPAPTRAPTSRSARFRRQHFPQATAAEWDDWHWQLAHRVTTLEQLERILVLSDEERAMLQSGVDAFPVAITPYYLSLIDPLDPGQPLRRTVIPTSAEARIGAGELVDPLGEEHDSPVPGVVHRYPDRVLFLTTSYCSTYCRYCTRSRMVGQAHQDAMRRARWEKGIAYIRANPDIRDVLLSGGDPLTLSDDNLEWLLRELRTIPHLEMLRIGTKIPAVLPQRVTPALVKMLKRYHPLWMSVHFTHPDELTPETAKAVARLANAGIPLGSQTVLLKGVNDEVSVLKGLFQGLLKNRVRPYYLYQCDPIPGSAHFRTTVAKGLEMIEGLRGHTTGYAVPQYVIDAPEGGGKIPLLPDYHQGQDERGVVLRNFEGRIFHYPDMTGKITGLAVR
ncbi:MAG: KamA family radical SAM protein [Deltaproteobacteria bacterium]|nr:KamA family radical SAM protein [Deltaproteobacteria bacterium]